MLKHNRVGESDDHLAFRRRIADAPGCGCAGLVESTYTAVLTEPKVELAGPVFLGGGVARSGDYESLAADRILSFEEDEGFEEPFLAAVRSLPADVGGEALCIPGVGYAVTGAHEGGVVETTLSIGSDAC